MHPSERQDSIRMSRCLARMLRQRSDLPDDGRGWFLVEDVANRGSMTREEIIELGRTDSRYELSPDGEMIRARDTCSLDIDYDMEVEPPEILYHGTSVTGFEGILRSGAILKMARSKVHLSDDPGKAERMGGRHSEGPPILLKVHAGRMHAAGMRFLCNENDVFLTEKVPLRYTERMSDTPVMHRMQTDMETVSGITSGDYTTIVRPYDDKRRMMRVGDGLILSSEDRSVRVTITELYVFDTLDELYRSIPDLDRCRLYQDSEDRRVEDMGVLGIGFRIADQT